jgi:heme-degrading monooxygenase HmoA
MVTEMMKVTIDPAKSQAFENAVARCAQLFAGLEGYHDLRLEREVETASHYYIFVRWTTIEDHRRISKMDASQQWRDQVGALYAAPPVVVHMESKGEFS